MTEVHVDNWSAYYQPGSTGDNPFEFALYGLARQWGHVPEWVRMDTSMPVLELGPGTKMTEGSERLEWPDYDFESPEYWRSAPLGAYRGRLPHEDNSVGGVVATHVLEHLFDPRPIISEISRVLAPGCPFNIVVPHADSNVFKHDLDHKTCFILDTWKNLLQDGYYDHTYGGKTPRLVIGANFKFAIKEGNEVVVTQLIKEG